MSIKPICIGSVILVMGLSQTCKAQTTGEMLGYGASEKLLIINADDFGMCHAENAATMDLLLGGHVTSATIMTPCPWFEEAAAFCREHPTIDVGVHLTLTAEWKRYKWGSVAPADLVKTLLTPQGYFPDDSPEVEARADLAEVEREFRAQLEKAKQAGIQLTHFDNHMGSAYGLATGRHFFEIVFKLSKEYGLPFRLPRNISERYLASLPEQSQTAMREKVKALTAQGFALPDYLESVQHGKTYDESVAAYQRFFRNLKPGVTELYIHAALPEEEMKAISGSWRNRDYDYRIFKSEETKKLLAELKVKWIGWRELQRLQTTKMK